MQTTGVSGRQPSHGSNLVTGGPAGDGSSCSRPRCGGRLDGLKDELGRDLRLGHDTATVPGERDTHDWPRELTSEEAHKFRRLGQPVVAAFSTVDGPAFEAVTTRQHLSVLLGPFRQPHLQAESGS